MSFHFTPDSPKSKSRSHRSHAECGSGGMLAEWLNHNCQAMVNGHRLVKQHHISKYEDVMYQPVNQVRLRGFLTEPARVFVSRSGQSRLTFRLEVWIDDVDLPPKKPVGVDYFSVVAFGLQFVGLASQLDTGREVALNGCLRSRDVETDARRVITEVVAKEITVLQSRREAQREQLKWTAVN